MNRVETFLQFYVSFFLPNFHVIILRSLLLFLHFFFVILVTFLSHDLHVFHRSSVPSALILLRKLFLYHFLFTFTYFALNLMTVVLFYTTRYLLQAMFSRYFLKKIFRGLYSLISLSRRIYHSLILS